MNSKLLSNYNVEGFDPNAACTLVVKTQPDGTRNEALFMKYAPAMAWFYTVYPNGCLNYTINCLNNDKCSVTASVYRDVNDTRPAAMATCTRYNNNTENGPYYDQNAVTAAYRKALGYLGFGTPYDAHPVEGQPVEINSYIPEMSDGGVPVPSIPNELLQQMAAQTAMANASVPVASAPEQMQPVMSVALTTAVAPTVSVDAEPPKKRRGRKPKVKVEEPVMVEDPVAPVTPVAEPVAANIPEEGPVAPMDNEINLTEDSTNMQPPVQNSESVREYAPVAPEPDEAEAYTFEDMQNVAEQAQKAAAEFAAPAMTASAPASAPVSTPVTNPAPSMEQPVQTANAVTTTVPLDIAEAAKCVFPCGKYKGKALEAAHGDGVDEYYRWFYENVPGIKNDPKLKAALEIYMEFYGC